MQLLSESNNALEQRARRLAQRVSLAARKSRGMLSLDNRGGFMLIDPEQNWIVAGEKFDLSPEGVISYCEELLDSNRT